MDKDKIIEELKKSLAEARAELAMEKVRDYDCARAFYQEALEDYFKAGGRQELKKAIDASCKEALCNKCHGYVREVMFDLESARIEDQVLEMSMAEKA